MYLCFSLWLPCSRSVALFMYVPNVLLIRRRVAGAHASKWHIIPEWDRANGCARLLPAEAVFGGSAQPPLELLFRATNRSHFKDAAASDCHLCCAAAKVAQCTNPDISDRTQDLLWPTREHLGNATISTAPFDYKRGQDMTLIALLTLSLLDIYPQNIAKPKILLRKLSISLCTFCIWNMFEKQCIMLYYVHALLGNTKQIINNS